MNGPAIQITPNGGVLGTADTAVPDQDYPNDGPAGGDPYIEHAFEWHEGQLDDLGALPGNNSSFVFEINGHGLGTGASETGKLDPLAHTPAQHAVLFRDGHVFDLGTLPGGTESFAVAVNARGQVAGMSNNAVPDATGFPNFFDWHTQVRTFVWQRGTMQDIGTLGGGDTVGGYLNARGQVAGDSFTNSIPNPATGYPTSHPYLWTDGHMRDLGSLGGTQSSTSWVNDRGEVVGQSSLTGEHAAHPFLWDGHRLNDLGTLGGNYGLAWTVNAHGAVTGWATPPGDDTIHTFLWRHGVISDLTDAASTSCTFPEAMNDRDEVVGGSCDGRALLWRRGTQYDLSSLAAPSDVVLTDATWIDNTGRIVSLGTLPNGNQHVFVLTPTGNAFARDGSPRVRVVHGSQTCTYPIRGLLPRKLPADDC